jgi:hypothetical protein
MSWKSLSEGRDSVPLRYRLKHLPLILAGPILRRTESDAVTVWVALKASREVTLKVYATDQNGSIIKHLLLKGTRSTVPLGQQLHIVAVTAKPVSDYRLESGQIYAYDLSFSNREQNLFQALNSLWLFPEVIVSYFEHQLPTFAMPPSDLQNLQIAHGSCRKLHGGGQDALPILDDSIAHYAKEPNSRLHQLFFTGDQIYGDDVADSLLWAATEVGDTLLGWEEHLPFSLTSSDGDEGKKPSELKPGQRTDIARDYGGFTAMLIDKPHLAKSHLFSLGEFFATYLLVWSPILWPKRLPKGKEVYKDPKQVKQWDEHARHVKDCIAQLWKVRRAMANVPTYMIFDDHDISDDWYLNHAWCLRVLGKPLGRRVVQNGLLAYAVFQAWGNTPDQFEQGHSGGHLLNAAAKWSASAGTDRSALEKIAKFLGLPQTDPETGLPQFKLDGEVLVLNRDYPDGTLPVEWHYTIRSFKHEVIVLDTRTWRGYPLREGEMGRWGKGDKGRILDPKWMDEWTVSLMMEGSAIAPPMLLSPTAFKQQIQKPLELTDQLKQTSESDIEMTFVVVPTNLVSLQIIDEVQRWELEKGNVFNSDVGDAWNLNEVALSMLLEELFKRRRMVVVLSGDIHYSGAVRLSYWFGCQNEGWEQELNEPSLGTQRREAKEERSRLNQTHNSNARVLAQLTASAFKNAELKTYLIHTKAKSLVPEQPQNWAGWNEPPELVEIQVTPDKAQLLDVEVPATGPIMRQLLGARGNGEIAWEIAIKDSKSLPDWQYHIEWIKRQKAAVPPWERKSVSSALSKYQNSAGWLSALSTWVLMLWRNQWLQEGEEVVGRNNLGVITLEWPQNSETAKAVIQDIYWQPPWMPSSVVYSRYFVPLQVANPPAPPKVVSPGHSAHPERVVDSYVTESF